MARPLSRLVALLAAASLGGWWLGSTRPPPLRPAAVVDVLDGDTIVVAWPGRSETVRLLGVDTPETVHPHRPVECFGPEAAAFTRARLLGRTVELILDRQARDRYGRLLAYVEVEGRGFSEALLAGGYARLLVIPPNGARGRALLDLELGARRAGRGLWSVCER